MIMTRLPSSIPVGQEREREIETGNIKILSEALIADFTFIIKLWLAAYPANILLLYIFTSVLCYFPLAGMNNEIKCCFHGKKNSLPNFFKLSPLNE